LRMAKLLVTGGKKLEGKLCASGAKNAALPVMAACILVKGDTLLKRVPNISDVRVMMELLTELGAKLKYDEKEETLLINTDNISKTRAPYHLVRKIHASFDVAGPLLSRFLCAEVPLPGGCVLGTRAVNFHLEGFRSLGAEVSLDHGYVRARASKLKGGRFYIGRSSVGATKNILMAACLAQGTSFLENAAREPEVLDLVNFLNAAGAKVSGGGTGHIRIDGVPALKGCEYEIISDRIEAGTYLLGGAITRGYVTIDKINPDFLAAMLTKLESASVEVIRGENFIRVKGRKRYNPVDIMTFPYPGFPTDLHPPMAAFLTVSDGTSFIEETIFDSRFNYVDELRRLGAKIRLVDRTVVITGVSKLTDAPVEASDLRAGGALVLAGLVAEGTTEILGLEHIDRGYQSIDKKFNLLGAQLNRAECK